MSGGGAYGTHDAGPPTPYARVDLFTGAVTPLFEAADYFLFGADATLREGNRYYALTTAPIGDVEDREQLVMGQLSGGEPTVLERTAPNQSFQNIVSTDRRLVWSVFDKANGSAQLRTRCKANLPP